VSPRQASFSRSALLCTLAFAHVCTAADIEHREAEMKAAYVFNFLKFVEWSPRTPSDSLVVCFRGAEPVYRALAESTASKTIGTRRIVVRPVTGDALAGCQVLYVEVAQPDAGMVGLSSLALTIGDSREFTRAGGVIGLYTESNRLRFVVNVGNARRADLQISSNLLKLATSVEQEATP
jgi:hypothetical protein